MISVIPTLGGNGFSIEPSLMRSSPELSGPAAKQVNAAARAFAFLLPVGQVSHESMPMESGRRKLDRLRYQRSADPN